MNSTDPLDAIDFFDEAAEFEEAFEGHATQRFAFELILFFLGLLGISVDTAISYTIFKFRKLRTPPNIFLASWSLADGCSLFWTPVNYKILLYNDHIPSVGRCALYELESSVHSIVVLSMILLTLDWCLANYFPSRSETFRVHYNIAVGLAWGVPGFLFLVNLVLCVKERGNLPTFLMSGFGVLCLAGFVLALQISRPIRKCRGQLESEPSPMLLMTTTYVIFLTVAYVVVVSFRGFSRSLSNFLLESIMYTTAPRNFLIMVWLHPDFKSYVKQALRCSRHKYVEETLAGEEGMPNQNHVQRTTSYIEFHSITSDGEDGITDLRQ